MIQAICLKKFRNKNNQIIGYRIQDKNGQTRDVKSEYLKQAIKNKQINVLNLTLTSDNKLIDKAYKPQKPQKSNSKDIIAKIKVLGTPFASSCGHTYYVIENSDTTIVYIPDDVKYLISGNNYGKPDFCTIKCKTLKVIGGSELTSTYNMFYDCKAQSIDLSSFDTSNVTNMKNMFRECKVQKLDLSHFDTSKVTDMARMFWGCQAQSLDLSSFDTSKVTYMICMLYECTAQVKATDRKILEELHDR